MSTRWPSGRLALAEPQIGALAVVGRGMPHIPDQPRAYSKISFDQLSCFSISSTGPRARPKPGHGFAQRAVGGARQPGERSLLYRRRGSAHTRLNKVQADGSDGQQGAPL
jgi:hypothetical protein